MNSYIVRVEISSITQVLYFSSESELENYYYMNCIEFLWEILGRQFIISQKFLSDDFLLALNI